MTKSIWPNDTYPELQVKVDDKSLSSLTCFVISPIGKNKERWDDLLLLIRNVCNIVSKQFQVNIEVIRADEITSAGIIHPEIWNKIALSDILIADVTGQNGNVLLELGVASAWRKKEQVIILKEFNPEEGHLFDINPARHVEYTNTFSGYQKLTSDLRELIIQAISSSPFKPTEKINIKLPYSASFENYQTHPELFTPDIVHRVSKNDSLEFGSLHVYQHSWMSIGNLNIRNVRVKAKVRFSLVKNNLPWIGIMIRSQHYFANYGHLVYINAEGVITRTVPEETLGDYSNEEIGRLETFSNDPFEYMDFTVEFDEVSLRVKIDSFHKEFPVHEMPHAFYSGRILIIPAYCRMDLQSIEVSKL